MHLRTMNQVLDQVIALAGEMGIRLVLPFIDQWDWVGVRFVSTYPTHMRPIDIYLTSGDDSPIICVYMHPQGIKSFARFRGFTNNLEDHFWTDARVRADFMVRGTMDGWVWIESVRSMCTPMQTLVHLTYILTKDVVRMVVTRVNTENGIRYSEDPTILAWEVRGYAGVCMRAWVDRNNESRHHHRPDGQRAQPPHGVDARRGGLHQGTTMTDRSIGPTCI